jgi:hypothetical protein
MACATSSTRTFKPTRRLTWDNWVRCR